MMHQTATESYQELLYHTVLRTVLVAACFVLLVSGIISARYLNRQLVDPLQPARIQALRGQLANAANDETLKSQIRQEDVRIRDAYFRYTDFMHEGMWLLLGGMVVVVVGLKTAGQLRRRLPYPPRVDLDDPRVLATYGRRAVLTFGVVLGIGAAGFIIQLGHPQPPLYLTQARQVLQSAAALQHYVPDPHEYAKNWPRFRGPDGTGFLPDVTAPTGWDVATKRGVVWSVEPSLPGKNSPIVWGNRVFISGADEHKRMVYCYDAQRGTALWEKSVEGLSCQDAGTEPLQVMEDTGYAAPTMTTDGRRVYAMFANGDLACFTTDGAPVWAKNMGRPVNTYGHATSLVMYRNRLILQFDQAGVEEHKSALLALDAATGNLVWQTKRPVPNSWSTPIIITEKGRTQIVTCGSPFVIAYDPDSGEECWRVECLGGDVAPSPIFADGLVYAVNTGSNLAAIRPDGQGDVTKSHVSWLAQEGLPDIVSPVSDGHIVLLIGTDGSPTCYDAKTGVKLWTHSYTVPSRATPVIFGRTIYLTDTTGVTHFLTADKVFAEQGTAQVGEPVETTPAYANGRLYIRGKQHLFCIGSR